jgi:signal transduction histidine kinase
MRSRLPSARRSSTRSQRVGGLAGAFVLAAGASLVALLAGSPVGALVGVGIAGLAGVLVVGHLLVSERRRHELIEEELTGQASFLESLVESFGAIAATLDVAQILELTRSEAERLFHCRAAILEPGEERRHGPAEDETVVPMRVRGIEIARLRLVRTRRFDRNDLIRATVLADFAARAAENAQLLAEANVREVERARLSDQLITAEQEERRRLALYLHDTSVQSLSGITLMLDAAEDFLRQERLEDARAIVTSALERQRAAIRGLRDLSFNLEPVVLRDQGFTPAVRALAEQLGLEKEIQIDVEVAPAEQLTEKAQAALYQIVREALHGSIRRGPPTRISVRVVPRDDGAVELLIADDAPGERRKTTFDPIAERARTLNGTLDVERGEDGGTTVRVTLPAYAARG